jgi:hypothetical protein
MRALERRTNALLKLEEAWAEWVGNPAGEKVHGYDPNIYQNQTLTRALTASPRQTQSQSQSEVVEPLIPGLEDPHAHISRHGMSNGNGTPSRSDSASTEPEPEPELQSEPEQSESSEHPQLSGGVEIDIDPETGRPHVHIHTTRPRPTFRPRWFGTKVDAIEHWEAKYVKADEEVRELRKKGMFPATHAAFVTLLEVKDAVSGSYRSNCKLDRYRCRASVTITIRRLRGGRISPGQDETATVIKKAMAKRYHYRSRCRCDFVTVPAIGCCLH